MPNDVLIVEDDPIIALDFEDTILGFGVKTVRTAANVAKALDLIADRPPDFALLDVSLIREKSFAVAERLEALKIPFAFVTGYGADARLPAAFAAKPRLPKPYSTDALQALLLKPRPCALSGCEPGNCPGSAARLTTPAWDRALSTTAPRRRGRATSPSSARWRRRS